MTTEFLHVLRDRSLVRTDREVKIVEGTRSLTGRGMEYNNESRELHAARRRAWRASSPNASRMKPPAIRRRSLLLSLPRGLAREGRPRQADPGRGEPHERRRRAAHEHLRGQRGAHQGHHARCAPTASWCARTPRASSSPPPPASRCASASARTRSRARRKASGWTARRCASRSTTASQKIELFDKARVNRGGDEVAGNYIFVDQRSEFYSGELGQGAAKRQGGHPAQGAERGSQRKCSARREEMSQLRSQQPAQALQVAHRGPGRVARGVERRGGRAARAERRRQDHLLLHDRRAWSRSTRARSTSTAASSRTCRSTAARAWASPTCRRRTRCSAASRWRRTCRRSSSCRGCRPSEIEPRLGELLKDLNIAHLRKHAAISLSGGERRRLEIARALGTRPAFILLDEPFAGVDPIAVLDIQRIIRFLKERGIGVLITDHNVRETLGICDRAYIINEGAVLASGHPEEIVYNDSVRRVYLGENFRM